MKERCQVSWQITEQQIYTAHVRFNCFPDVKHHDRFRSRSEKSSTVCIGLAVSDRLQLKQDNGSAQCNYDLTIETNASLV